jgi:hypothetical protein
MAKVYGIHPIELKPGVSAAEFEQFIRGEGAALFQTPNGAKSSVLKADRGARAGRYAVLLEFDSVEARNQMFPVADQTPAPPDPQAALYEKLFTLVSGIGDPATYTDYVVVGE